MKKKHFISFIVPKTMIYSILVMLLLGASVTDVAAQKVLIRGSDDGNGQQGCAEPGFVFTFDVTNNTSRPVIFTSANSSFSGTLTTDHSVGATIPVGGKVTFTVPVSISHPNGSFGVNYVFTDYKTTQAYTGSSSITVDVNCDVEQSIKLPVNTTPQNGGND